MNQSIRIFTVFCLLLTSASLWADPKLDHLGVKEIELGRFDMGIEKKGIFKIKNTGTKTLTIEKVTKSCGCTSAAIESKKIEPGKETKLVITVKADKNKMGPFIDSVYVHSNDPKNGISKFSIIGFVNPKLD